MRMRSLNGWMRLWVLVCSPFWIGAIYTAVQDVPNPDERSRVLTHYESLGEWQVDGCYSCSFPFMPNDAQITESLVKAHDREVEDDYELALMLATIFPFTLLALGYGIAWVRRGFKQKNTSSLP